MRLEGLLSLEFVDEHTGSAVDMLQINHAGDGSSGYEPGWNKVERRQRRPKKDDVERLRGTKVTQAGSRKQSKASNGIVPFDG
jgi:hypothetical protein